MKLDQYHDSVNARCFLYAFFGFILNDNQS